MRDGDTGPAGRTQSPADRFGGTKTTGRRVRALRPSVPGAGGWSPGAGAARSPGADGMGGGGRTRDCRCCSAWPPGKLGGCAGPRRDHCRDLSSARRLTGRSAGRTDIYNREEFLSLESDIGGTGGDSRGTAHRQGPGAEKQALERPRCADTTMS